jgi:hypothetical protein
MPLPKLFMNLRASRATELVADHPGHVAAEWLGHSDKIATKHYWRTTDVDFDRAARALLNEPSLDATERQSGESEGGHPENSAGNAAEYTPLYPVPAFKWKDINAP